MLSQKTTEIELRRILPASCQRVFDAWRKPEALQHWWGPTDNYAFAEAKIDFRVGGTYEISMRVVNKDIVRTCYGEYLEINEPTRLAFTWNWKHDETPMNSVVSLDFIELGPNKTELVLRHEKLPDTELGKSHKEGWNGVFGKLEKYLATL